jgi:hypothetical protein
LSLAIAGGVVAGLDVVAAARLVIGLAFIGTVLVLFVWSRGSLSAAATSSCADVAVVPAAHPSPDASFTTSEPFCRR